MGSWFFAIFLGYALVPVHYAAEDRCELQNVKTIELLNQLCDLQQSQAFENNCTCKQSNPIAFQAEASKSLSNLPRDAVVIFDKMELNVGDAYDPKTGTFTAPDDGVYSFTWTVMSKPGKVFHTVFTVDGNPLSRGYLDLYHSTNHFSATKNVLVKMTRGSKAWIQTHDNHGGYLWGGHNGLSTFNGHKL